MLVTVVVVGLRPTTPQPWLREPVGTVVSTEVVAVEEEPEAVVAAATLVLAETGRLGASWW
jgi:hypothetical protein